MDVKFIANIIRKTIITRNPNVADRVKKTEEFQHTYSTVATFDMITRTGGTVTVSFTVDRNSEYTKFLTVEYTLVDTAGKRKSHKIFHYSFDMYERNAFNRIVNEIKHDLQLDTPKK